jgi:glutamate formiminotransferase
VEVGATGTGAGIEQELIECVPNFSEGRDRGTIFAIIAAMRLPGVMLLDYTADRFHNRMVVTIAGTSAGVAEAAVRAVGVAAERIDLRMHRGVHPRLGAADVVPFVPLRGTNLERTAALARQAGEEIFQRYGVPVFFYEAAAMRPEFRRLENLRRGQFERAAELGKKPDVGGPKIHLTAGAAIVGARDLLVATNALLDSEDVRVAQAIARGLRESGGGLKSVKALGVQVRGHAQVTMNLTDFRETPVQMVYDRVRALAAEHGVSVIEGEIIGLVPQAALAAGSEWTTLVPGFAIEKKVLEQRLQHPMEWPENEAALELSA